MNRESMIERIRGQATGFDVCIIGGGATGLGAALDAASRGYSVVLVDRSDFAKGTSSRSTKLVHGGVRYLKQGNISLVMSALRERGHMLANAPHLVRERRFVIPVYSHWDCFFYGVGMKVYDWLSGKWAFTPSRCLSADEVVRCLPTVETKGLKGGIVYSDGQFDDSRYAVSQARTAVDLGACVVNYVECTGFEKRDGKITGIRARDVETGEEFFIGARCVINATGVFVDAIRRMDDPEALPVVTASQGVHLVLPRRFLPGDHALMVPKTSDGRVLFMIPWHECVIVGTTDTPVSDIPVEPRPLEEEIRFLMEHTGIYLHAKPERSDVLSVFTGLRPLVSHSHGKSGKTSAISRDHTMLVSGSKLLTITGGKWTTYRKMAEDVIDLAIRECGLPPVRSRTETLKLHDSGEKGVESGISNAGAGVDCVHPDLDLTVDAVKRFVREEMARTVEDVLARRSRCLFLNAAASIQAAPDVAAIMARELGRDESWIHSQVEAYTAVAENYLLGGGRTGSS